MGMGPIGSWVQIQRWLDGGPATPGVRAALSGSMYGPYLNGLDPDDPNARATWQAGYQQYRDSKGSWDGFVNMIPVAATMAAAPYAIGALGASGAAAAPAAEGGGGLSAAFSGGSALGSGAAGAGGAASGLSSLGTTRALGLAATLASSLGSGDVNNPSAQQLSDISSRLYNDSLPLRTELMNRSMSLLNGDITNTPMYEALKGNVDTNFLRAKNNIIASTPAGGSLTAALTNLEGSRAADMTQGTGVLYENELNRALGLATNSVPTALSGLSSAANIQSQQLMAQQARDSAMKSGIGNAFGTMLASRKS